MRLPVVAATVLLVLPAHTALASPEWHAGLQPALSFDVDRGPARFAFAPSLDAEVLFGRTRAGTFGAGPALELGTWAFSDFRVTPMARALIPVGELDLACSAGPQFALDAENRTAIAGRVQLGYRAYNYTGAYGAGFGVFGGVDHALTADSTQWLLGLHFDAMWASLPFIALASWVVGE